MYQNPIDDVTKLHIKLWDKYRDKNTVLHRPSKYSPISIEIAKRILLSKPSYPYPFETTNIVRFNRHIYEILFHVAKKKQLLYITIKLEVSNV